MLVYAYIGYGVLAFFVAVMAGTFLSAIRGRIQPIFAGPSVVAGLLLGVPGYFVGRYLHTHGSEGFSLLVLIIAAPLGLIAGLHLDPSSAEFRR